MPFGVAAVGVLGAGATAFAASQSADAQKSAAQQASNTELGMFNATARGLNPFTGAGQNSLAALEMGLGITSNPTTGGINYDPNAPLAASFQPTEQQLEQTPGYQFNLTQGEKAVTNSNAARGLGVSGAALRGAADYATGLADSTYQNQFNNFQTQQNNQYNRLAGLASIGESAAAGVGSAATQTGASIGGNIIGAGNATAAANMATANAITGAGNNASNLLVLQSLLGKGGGAGGNSGSIFGP